MMNSNFGRTFLFLTELAWKNRVALPALIMVGCMVFNFHWEIEINIHTERIGVQDIAGLPGFGGLAMIEHLEQYSDDEYDDDDDELDEYYDTDYDDDSYDEDDLYSSSYDDDDDGEDDREGGLGALNGTIHINRYAVVNIHNGRR